MVRRAACQWAHAVAGVGWRLVGPRLVVQEVVEADRGAVAAWEVALTEVGPHRVPERRVEVERKRQLLG
jgi:hypothetical protein